MKTLHLLIAALLLASHAFGRENPYDLLGHCLTPFVTLIAEHAKDPNRALNLAMHLEQMTGLPEELSGAKADFALEYPDKLRIHAPLQGEDITVCRNGQEVWVFPGSKAGALLQKLESDRKLPKGDSKYALAPFSLPIPEKQIVFLPTLFQVRDAGDEVVDGISCRVLDVGLNTALAKAVKSEEWSGRLWVSADAHPVRLVLRQGTTWSATVRFDTVTFQRTLPAETWKPLPEQATDVAKISPMRYDQLLRALIGGK